MSSTAAQKRAAKLRTKVKNQIATASEKEELRAWEAQKRKPGRPKKNVTDAPEAVVTNTPGGSVSSAPTAGSVSQESSAESGPPRIDLHSPDPVTGKESSTPKEETKERLTVSISSAVAAAAVIGALKKIDRFNAENGGLSIPDEIPLTEDGSISVSPWGYVQQCLARSIERYAPGVEIESEYTDAAVVIGTGGVVLGQFSWILIKKRSEAAAPPDQPASEAPPQPAPPPPPPSVTALRTRGKF